MSGILIRKIRLYLLSPVWILEQSLPFVQDQSKEAVGSGRGSEMLFSSSVDSPWAWASVC